MPVIALRRLSAIAVASACLVGAGAVAATTDADAARVKSTPTGDARTDDYCRQVADLINSAFAEGDRQDLLGNYEEGQAWWDLAIEMLGRARANGCDFTQARLHGKAFVVRKGTLRAVAGVAP